jgi:hypothetical protein
VFYLNGCQSGTALNTPEGWKDKDGEAAAEARLDALRKKRMSVIGAKQTLANVSF